MNKTSNGDMMSSPAPTFTVSDASLIALEKFGVRGEARSLPGHVDQNFQIDTDSSERYVLKIANTEVDVKDLDLQQSALLHLENSGIVLPRVQKTVAREWFDRIQGREGSYHRVWMVSYLEGRTLATVTPHFPHLLEGLGHFLGTLNNELESFSHPHADREYLWDLLRAAEMRRYLSYIDDPKRQGLVSTMLDQFEERTKPILELLPKSIIHNDANDYNVLVSGVGYEAKISGIIDFGDMIRTSKICEVAIAATYIMLDKPDPVAAGVHVVRGYHNANPLSEEELEVLYDLIITRLCTSVLVSAFRVSLEPENEYLRISEAPAWELLERLTRGSRSLALYRFRDACGYTPCPNADRAVQWLRQHSKSIAAVVKPDVRTTTPLILDLSVSRAQVGGVLPDMARATEALMAQMRRAGAAVAVGRYDEPRLVYTADQYGHSNNDFDERRTIHLGIDLFQPAGFPVFAPLEGTVHHRTKCMLSLDFGGLVVLRHEGEDIVFYTLYGHLSHASVDALEEGMKICRGQKLGELGDPAENGGWIPHLHFQILGDDITEEGEFLGVAPASQRSVWLGICPDPNLILGIPEEHFPEPQWKASQIESLRKRHIGGNLSVSYRTPLHIVRGYRQHLFDATGRDYLDAVNNVPHVGHSHPAVARAAQRQQRVLNTNTRYLHETLVRYAQRLANTFPDPLEVCYFVNSGSEANDLALRLAHAYTGASGILVLDGAYHGHLSSLIAISPYKFDGPGGEGAPAHVQITLSPDPYRGAYRSAKGYIRDAGEAIGRMGRDVCAFISESILGCGGQIEFPAGYLQGVYHKVREAGGLCIADEVQVGFGRTGTHFWGFETQGVVPDIVVLGKPMGNGHPIAGVVTTKAVAESFDNGMEFFSTFGGNPVSCAVGMAVLDVIERERLQENAHRVGSYLLEILQQLQHKHEIIGDVRGRGLFIGVELVLDRELLTPAAPQARYVANRLADRGVLISTDGPLYNVLKIKPPMVFSQNDADQLARTLDQVLSEDGAKLA